MTRTMTIMILLCAAVVLAASRAYYYRNFVASRAG